jgi:hypothetical protein
MMFGFMFDTFLNAFVLCGLLFLVARHEADFEFRKVAIVSAFISLGNTLLPGLLFLCLMDRGLSPEIAFLIWLVGSLLLIMAFFVFMIMKFCWVTFPKALLIMILFIAFSAAFNLARTLIGMSQDGGVVSNARMLLGAETAEPETPMDPETAQLLKDLEAAADSMAEGEFIATNGMNDAGEPTFAERPAEEPVPDVQVPVVTVGQIDESWAESKKLIKVSGSMANADGRSAVIVNDRIVHPGDTISVLYKNKSYIWRLNEDTSKGFVWQPVPED